MTWELHGFFRTGRGVDDVIGAFYASGHSEVIFSNRFKFHSHPVGITRNFESQLGPFPEACFVLILAIHQAPKRDASFEARRA